MATPMQTNHTTDGSVVMSTHKYNFFDRGDWSLCSDNCGDFYFDPRHTGHVTFDPERILGHPIGQTFTAHNHENTTTVLQFMERVGMLKCYTDRSMVGHGQKLYTEGGPAAPEAPLIEMPCNMALPPGRHVGGGVIMRELPCSSTILSEGHLEQIFNHAVHILYTEGPRNSSGPGFSVQYEETGNDFYASNTCIVIRFYFNGYPVWVKFARLLAAGRSSPCALFIRPDGPGLPGHEVIDRVPPVITRNSRLRNWFDEHDAEEGDRDFDNSDNAPPRNRDVYVWKDDGSFCDLQRARALGWDVSTDPREVARRAEVEARVAAALAARAVEDSIRKGESRVRKGEWRVRKAEGRVQETTACAATALSALRAERWRQRNERAEAEHRAARAAEEAHVAEQQRLHYERAETERIRRRMIHDAAVEAEQAEAKAKAALRAHQAAVARAERAARAPAAYTPYRAPPTSKKAEKKAARAARRAGTHEEATTSELAHNVHTLPEQHEIRSDCFNSKQELKHAEKLMRIAQEKVERLRRSAAEASMEREAAVHVVPPPSTINDSLVAAIQSVEL